MAAQTQTVGQAATSASLLPVYAMALGTFAIGTEGFMIAPLLPQMAADFGRSVADAALLITVFTLTLSLSSPILTVLTGRLERRALLIAAMGLFTFGNVTAFLSTGFGGILAARILLAAAAGLYVPNANALAGAVAGPQRHGRALAIVSGGMTIAIALGLPIGAVIGHALGWRATFLAVGMMGAIATLGILLGVDRRAGADIRVPGFAERVETAARPVVLKPLLVTLLWGVGAYSAYPFIAPYLATVVGFGAGGVGATVSLWGVSAAFGVVAGGLLNDRLGPARVIGPSLLLLGTAFLILSASAALRAGGVLTAGEAMVPVLAAVSLWGITVWSFFPAQMAKLIGAAGRPAAPVVLSLNTSVMYFGFAAGSWIGSLVLAHGALGRLTLVSAAAEAAALLLFMLFERRR